MFWKKKEKEKEKEFDYYSDQYLNSLKKRLEYLQALFTFWNRQQNDNRRSIYEREKLYLSNKAMMEHHQIEINSLQKQIEYIEAVNKKEP